MNNLKLTLVAGLLFGLWPFLMNRSGLNGSISASVFALTVAVFVVPFGLHQITTSGMPATTPLGMSYAIGAGIIGGIGMLIFNWVLANTPTTQTAITFMLIVLVQTAVSAAYQLVIAREMTLDKAIGFVFAIIAGVLLTRAHP